MRWIILVILIIFSPAFSLAKEISYPTNQVERPLTLPDGMWEFSGDLWYSQRQGYSNGVSYPVFSIRYGITDDLEFYPLGLKYRILRDASFEFIIKGRVTGLGYSSVDGTTIWTEFGAEAKQRVHPKFAIIYHIEDNYTHRSNIEDDTDIGISLGGDFSFNEKLSLELTGTYRKLWGFNMGEGRVFKAVIYYNIIPNFDILFEGVFNDYKYGDRLYLPENFKGESYGIGFNWRF